MTLAVTDTVGRRGGFRGNFEMYISAQLSCIPTKGQPVKNDGWDLVSQDRCLRFNLCIRNLWGIYQIFKFAIIFQFSYEIPILSTPVAAWLGCLWKARDLEKKLRCPRATSQNVARSVWWNLFKIWTRNALDFQIAYLFAMEQPDFQPLAECYKQQVPAGLGTGMCLLHQWMGGGDKAGVLFCSWFAFPKICNGNLESIQVTTLPTDVSGRRSLEPAFGVSRAQQKTSDISEVFKWETQLIEDEGSLGAEKNIGGSGNSEPSLLYVMYRFSP